MRTASYVALVAWLCLEWVTRSVQANTIFCSDPEMCDSLTTKDKKEYLRFGRDVSEDEVDKRGDPFLRFGKRQDPFLRFGRQDPFLRFGRGDPFLRFGKDDPYLRFGKRQDPFLRFGRQDPFLRFGRGDPFLRFGKGDPYLRFGKRQDPFLRFGRQDPFLRFGRGDPFLRFGKKNDPFLRFGREYMRFGRGDPFLRFGKSVDSQPEFEDTLTQSENSATRRKRSAGDQDMAAAGADNALLRSQRDVTDQVTSEEPHAAAENGPYLRFGRANGGYLGFGKQDGDDTQAQFEEEAKREYMRFGRALSNAEFLVPEENSQPAM